MHRYIYIITLALSGFFFATSGFSATIGDSVWVDDNADGLRQASETTGLSGITVNLLDVANAIITNEITDASGNYLFANVTAGTYRVQFVAPAGSVFSPTGFGLDSSVNAAGFTTGFTVGATNNVLNIDAGLFQPASISGSVVSDLNGNGFQDGNEIGQAGIPVQLIREVAGIQSIIATAVTGANGSYLFAGLDPVVGTTSYRIQVQAPANFLFTGTGTSGTGLGSPISLASGDAVSAATAHISSGAGCPDVDMWVTPHNIELDAFGGGMTTGSVTVAGAGILGGERDVQFSIFSITTPPTQNQLATSRVGANSGQYVMDAQRGTYFTRSCQTWDGMDGAADTLDATGLGGIDLTLSDDPLVPNGAFELFVDPDQDSEITIQVYTDAGNMSEFSFQPVEDVGAVYQQPYASFSPVLGGGADFSNVGAIVMCIESLEEDLDVLLQPFRKVPLKAALGNRVWHDLDANGSQDLGEPGLAGVAVRIYDAANPASPLTNTTTDASGQYLFECLQPGSYFVEFDCAPGFVQSPADATGVADDFDSDAVIGTKRTGPVTLGAGDSDITLDAGFYMPAKLGDLVWLDGDNNGQQDVAPAGVPGVTVQLMDAAGTVLNSQVTGTDGLYCFDGLTPGDYKVNFVWPPNYVATLKDTGDDATDSDIDDANPMTPVVTLSSGETNLTLDAGLVLLNPDYEIFKDLVSPADAAGNPLIAEPGNPITFTITVTNTGDTVLSSVPLTDTYDQSFLQFVSASPTVSTPGAGNLQWIDLGPLSVGAAHTVTVNFTARQSTQGSTLLNTAETTPVDLATGQALPTKDADAPYLIGQPNYTITKDRTSPVGIDARVGDNVVFDIVVRNTGELPLTVVPLADTYDAADLMFVSASTTPDGATAGSLEWNNIGPIAVGGVETVTVVFQALQSTAGATDFNQACTTPATANGMLSEGCATAPYRVLVPSYSIRKERISPLTLPDTIGGQMTFNIVVENTGEIDLAMVPLNDVFDASVLSFNSAVPAQTAVNGSAITWTDIGSIAVGGTRTVSVIFDVTGSSMGQMLTNTVCTTPTTVGGTTLAEQCDDASYQVVDPAIDLVKTVHAGQSAGSMCPTAQNTIDDLETGVAGAPITYCFAISNTGDTTLTNLRLDDPNLGLGDISQFTYLSGSTPLPPGATVYYYFETTLQNDLVNTANTSGTPADPAGNPLGGVSDLTASDDAEVRLEAVSVGDFVWVDADADGIQDPGESGLGGVRVLLKDPAGIVLETAITAPSGRYFFTNLNPGQYKVCFELPEDCLPTSTNAGPVGLSSVGVQNGTHAGGGPLMETPLTAFLPNGTSDLTLDQGVVKTACIGDTVWEDIAADGNPTNDNLDNLGIANAEVSLFRVEMDGSRTLIDTQTTGESGDYKFNVAPGCYEVSVDTNTIPDRLSNFSRPLVQSTCVASGEFERNLDFGFFPDPTAVEMVSISAATDADGSVTVDWETGWEDNALGFQVFRSATLDGERTLVNAALVLAQGAAASYSVTDAPGEGIHFYWISELDSNLVGTDYGPAAAAIGSTGGSLVLVDTAAANLRLGGILVPTIETEGGLLAFAADTSAELAPADGDALRMAGSDATAGDGTPFVVDAGSLVLDVANPLAPVVLAGEALSDADYYAPAGNAAIRVE